MENENTVTENIVNDKSSNPFADGLNPNDSEVNEEKVITDDSETEQQDEVCETENSEEADILQNTEEQQEPEQTENAEKNEDSPKKNIFEGLFSKKNQSDEDLKKLKEECDKINNQYLRLAADFDNYRKRQAAERENLIKFGMEQALKKMIEVADNFERAEKSLEAIDDIEKAKEAFTVLAKQFRDSMAKLGLEEINAEGEKFDPNLHEAVMQTQTDEYPEETVMKELQKGYKYGDKVLRPSMVSVAVN